MTFSLNSASFSYCLFLVLANSEIEVLILRWKGCSQQCSKWFLFSEGIFF
jgi:hypothetical protein